MITLFTRATALAATALIGWSLFPAPVATALEATAPVVAAGSVDVTKTGTLTINKFKGEAGQTTDKLSDITFEVEKLQMTNQLNTAAGWAEAAALTTSSPVDATFSKRTATTAAGVANLTALPVGVYKVTELQHGNYTVNKPFLVTLPLLNNKAADQSTNGTGVPNYDVVVSPKNQEIIPQKSVKATGASLGDTIEYTITTPVPGQDLSELFIADNMPVETDLTTGTMKVTVVGATVALTAGDDYTLAEDNRHFQVTFKDAGLTKLAAARANTPELKVQLVFNAVIKTIPANGVINNQATVKLPYAPTPLKTDFPGKDNTDDPTPVYFATLSLTNTFSDAPAAKPNDGEYRVFVCTQDANNKWVIKDPQNPLTGVLAGENAKTDLFQKAAPQATSPDNPVTTVNGFGYDATGETKYCAVQVKAPKGYLINPEPTPVTVTPATAMAPAQLAVTIKNIKDSFVGQLPATGGTMILVILGLGAGMLLLAFWWRRREEEREAAPAA